MDKFFQKGSAEEEVPKGVRRSLVNFHSISVQPVGLLAVMSLTMNHLIYQNLLMESICRVDLGYPSDTCKDIVGKISASYKDEEREIQKIAAGVQATISVLCSIIGVLVVLYMGPWSDANGRRGPLLLSVSSILIGTGMLFVGYMFLGNFNGLAFALLATLPFHLSGGIVTFCMSAYSYVADTTSKEDRTVRTGILSGMIRAGGPLGFGLGGLAMRREIGAVPYIAFSLVLNVLTFLIVWFGVKNPGRKLANRNQRKDTSCLRIFNPFSKLKEIFSILFQQRPGRAKLFLLVLSSICYVAPMSGEGSNLYLFTREKFQWNASDYGFFSLYNLLMSAAGIILSTFILSKALKMSDPKLGFIAGLSQIGSSFLYAFSSSGGMMYFASALDMMNGMIGVVVRSMLSKRVEPNEVGKWFALLGVLDSLVPIPMAPAYAIVYRNTLTSFTGAFFLLSAIVTFPAQFVFLYFMCKGEKKNTVTLALNDEELKDVTDSLTLTSVVANKNNEYLQDEKEIK